MKPEIRPSLCALPLFACVLAATRISLPGQTIEVVGSAASLAVARIPVINDAGNVLYVNGSSYVIGSPATPVQRSFAAVSALLAPGAGDTVPYVLSSNGTVTCISPLALVQSNLALRMTVAQGGTPAAGFGNSLIKYALYSPPSVSGVFDYGVAPDDTIAFRAEVSSNNFFNQTIGVYAGPVTNLSLVMDSFHAPPGLPGYTVNNNGYFHACRNAKGLSLFIGQVYNNAIGDSGYGIWLHDAVNGIRLAHLASPYYGSSFPGYASLKLSGTEFGINHWPAMDDEGRYAFIAQGYSSLPPFTAVAAVVAGFEGNLQPVAYSGLAVPGLSGRTFSGFSGNGPIRMGQGGKLVFLASITGTGITPGVNDRVLVIGSNPADLQVLAQAGAQAPGMPAGALWKPLIIDASASLENAFYPINDQLVMFGNNRVAFVGQVTGGPSPGANDSGIWVTGDAGDLTLLARRGSPLTTTTITATPTNYFALEGGSGRDGKPSGGNRMGQLAFANGVNTYRVTYPQPLALALNPPVLRGGQVQLSFSTVAGTNYYVQWRANLAGTGWANIRTNVGDGSVKTNLIPPVGGQGYYRLTTASPTGP
jgi:hypothetical protein